MSTRQHSPTPLANAGRVVTTHTRPPFYVIEGGWRVCVCPHAGSHGREILASGSRNGRGDVNSYRPGPDPEAVATVIRLASQIDGVFVASVNDG